MIISSRLVLRLRRLMCGRSLAFRRATQTVRATPPTSRAQPYFNFDRIGKAKPYRTSGGRAASANSLLARRRLLALFFSRRLNQRCAGHHVAFIRLNQTYTLSTAARLAYGVGFQADQLGLLRDDHDL